jgi:hypothetical protein
MKQGPARWMRERDHLTIEEVSQDGEPLFPKKNTNAFVTQCIVHVQDMVPISNQEWNKPKGYGVSYVTDRAQKMLWESRISHLSVFEDDELTKAMREKFKQWALNKMAAQFNNNKKILYNESLKAGKSPEFIGQLEKLRDH